MEERKLMAMIGNFALSLRNQIWTKLCYVNCMVMDVVSSSEWASIIEIHTRAFATYADNNS
jgi:hypothetical protein